MDPFLAQLVDADTPQLNASIAGGLATEHMQEVETYLNSVIKSTARGFPEGLEYLGCSRCTPEEEFTEVVRKRSPKRMRKVGGRQAYDTARSDLYMMKYFFSFKGEPLPPRYIYLPYVGQAGSLQLSGSRFNISPVITDRVISVGYDSVFVRLLRDRMTFHRDAHSYMASGEREIVQVVHSEIHNSKKKAQSKPAVRANTTMMHYLLCKYGFAEAFRRFGKCSPVVSMSFETSEYPDSDWIICASAKVKPRGVGRGIYTPPDIKVAVRRDEYTPMVKNMIAGFFYVVDHFPGRITPELVNNPTQWMVLLGNLLWSANVPVGKIYEDVSNHLTSLDEYVDTIAVQQLAEIGLPVANLYEFFAIVIERFNDWLLSSTDKINSLYEKEMTILYYVLFNITSAIIKMHYKLMSMSKKELAMHDIMNVMKTTIRQGLIYSLNRDHGEVTTVGYPGDNMAFKVTSTMTPQSESNKKRRGHGGDRSAIHDKSKKLHVSVAEVGAYSAMTKSDPYGHSKINPHLKLDHKSVVLRDPQLKAMLDATQELIKA